MRVERLDKSRIEERMKVSAIAFTFKLDENDDGWRGTEEIDIGEREQWGAIDDESGRLMASLALRNYQARICSSWVPLTGIGGVATLPEYRRSGAIRAIFKETLPYMYKSGVILSGLYPFSHAFYRKFGYEVTGGSNKATVTLEQLRAFAQPDAVRMIESPTDMLAARGIYEQFASRRNLAMRRHFDVHWKAVMGGDPYKDMAYKYLLYRSGEPCAYIKFTRKFDDKEQAWIADATEAAYLDGDALRRVLGFMSTFYPHYEKLRIALPTDVNLAAIAPDPYDVTDDINHSYMLRAINAKALLEALTPAPGFEQIQGHFTVALTDDFIRQNNAVYEVTLAGGRVTCESRPLMSVDMELSIGAFTQLATGCVSIEQAQCRADARFNRIPAAARALLTLRPQYCGDHY